MLGDNNSSPYTLQRLFFVFDMESFPGWEPVLCTLPTSTWGTLFETGCKVGSPLTKPAWQVPRSVQPDWDVGNWWFDDLNSKSCCLRHFWISFCFCHCHQPAGTAFEMGVSLHQFVLSVLWLISVFSLILIRTASRNIWEVIVDYGLDICDTALW